MHDKLKVLFDVNGDAYCIFAMLFMQVKRREFISKINFHERLNYKLPCQITHCLDPLQEKQLLYENMQDFCFYDIQSDWSQEIRFKLWDAYIHARFTAFLLPCTSLYYDINISNILLYRNQSLWRDHDRIWGKCIDSHWFGGKMSLSSRTHDVEFNICCQELYLCLTFLLDFPF